MRVRIYGKSMEPSFQEGSVFFVSRLLVKLTPRKMGEVVVVRDPRDRNRLILKRIAKIDRGEIFLLGDNADQSTDSRIFGSVKRNEIVGKPIFKHQGKETSLPIAMLLLGLVGIADATYLTYKHFAGGEVVCVVGAAADCNIVLGSSYAVILGIPMALFGLFYYATVVMLAWLYLRRPALVKRRHILGLTALGFVATLYLLYLQAYVLYAYCFFCIMSAITATTIFVLAIVLNRLKGRIQQEKHE